VGIKSNIILIILFFVGSNNISAQNKNDIYRHPGNEKFLEHLIKIKVDSVRATKGLLPLANDSILYIASKYHAGYLLKLGKLDHYENEFPDRKTPQLRAEYFGAENYLVGENLVSSQFGSTILDKKGKIRNNFTYDEISSNLVIAWVNSPGHYKNMITKDYNSTGLSVIIDPEKNIVFSVQKFANILYKYDFTENKKMFDYSDFVQPPLVHSFSEVSLDRHPGKHAWKLKTPKDSISFCNSCNSNIDSSIYLNRIEKRGNKIVFVSPDPSLMNELLRKRRNGLAIEVMEYGQYDCGNPEFYTRPSRRNNQCTFSGTVLEPVYRKKLKSGFKGAGKKKSYKKIKQKIAEDKVKYFECTIAKLPKDNLSGLLEFNLVVIQKKKICRVWHFSDACGNVPDDLYSMPFQIEIPEYVYTPSVEFEKITFEIPFEQGKSVYNRKDIQPILDSLIADNFEVDSLEIRAFSSLEGNDNINKELQKQRAKTLAEALLEKQNNKIKYTVTATENFRKFEEQINSHSELKIFEELSHDELKKKINEPGIAEKYEKYLAQQRKAKITMSVRITVTENGMEKHLIKKFNSIQKSVSTSGFPEEKSDYIDTLIAIQHKAYLLIKNKKAANSLLTKLESKNLSRDLKRNAIIYSEDLGIYKGKDSAETERNRYNAYSQLNDKEEMHFDVWYNQLRFIIRDKKKFPEKETYKILQNNCYSTFTNDKEKRLAIEASVNYHLRVCREQGYNEESLKYLRDFFVSDPLATDSVRYEIGELFTYFKKYNYAYQVLMPSVFAGRNHHPTLMLVAKLSYSHIEETHSVQYHNELMSLEEILTNEEWCSLFVGPCNISYQVLDYEPFRNFYCEKCSDYENFAKTPEKWK